MRYGYPEEYNMPVIRPVIDLETSPREISNAAHASKEPIFLTKEGYGDLVVLSMETWEDMNFDNEIYRKLLESSVEAKTNPRRLTHDEVFLPLRKKIADYRAAHPDVKD
jgi:PHD/YefM family antitoxin component YafN of YafNO toxin-antitoxin module